MKKRAFLKAVGTLTTGVLIRPSHAVHAFKAVAEDLPIKPQKLRVGTLVHGFFSEHPTPTHKKFDNRHRPLNAGRLLEGLVKLFDTSTNIKSEEPATLPSRHIHLLQVVPGGKTKDIKHSDDVVVSVQPFKTEDLSNVQTLAGLLMRIDALTWPEYDFYTEHDEQAKILRTIDTLKVKQNNQAMRPTAEDIFQRTTETRIKENTLNQIGRRVFNAHPININGDVFFAPKPRNYCVIKIKHHDTLHIEHAEELTYEIKQKKSGRGYNVTFKKNDIVVNGLNIKAPRLKQENIKFSAVPYKQYTALEKGHADLANAEAGMIFKIAETVFAKKSRIIPSGISKAEQTILEDDIKYDVSTGYMNDMRDIEVNYTLMLAEAAKKTNQSKTEIKTLENILRILKDKTIKTDNLSEALTPMLVRYKEMYRGNFNDFKGTKAPSPSGG